MPLLDTKSSPRQFAFSESRGKILSCHQVGLDFTWVLYTQHTLVTPLVAPLTMVGMKQAQSSVMDGSWRLGFLLWCTTGCLCGFIAGNFLLRGPVTCLWVIFGTNLDVCTNFEGNKVSLGSDDSCRLDKHHTD